MIRIHYPTYLIPEDIEEKFYSRIDRPGWNQRVVSLGKGQSPELFSRGSMFVMFGWTDVEANTFLRLWSGAFLTLELKEEEENDILTRIQSRSISFTSPVDQRQ